MAGELGLPEWLRNLPVPWLRPWGSLCRGWAGGSVGRAMACCNSWVVLCSVGQLSPEAEAGLSCVCLGEVEEGDL